MHGMYEVIAAPFLREFLILRPGIESAMRIPAGHYQQLRELSAASQPAPAWLVRGCETAWGITIPAGPLTGAVLVREPSDYGYGRASWELNLGCNYDCEHCYLDLKRFEGLAWDQRAGLLRTLRDAGVVWLQMTGGEPLIDKLFPQAYVMAWDMGMMVAVSTNASRLWRPEILELLDGRRPYRLTISVYGSTAATYDTLVRRRGAYEKFRRGLDAACEAGLPISLNLIVTRTNDAEVGAMTAMAEKLGLPHNVFAQMAPTIAGSARSLPAQSLGLLKARAPFTGCNAGHTFFHVDPHGRASICKVGRDPYIDLVSEGAEGLRRLGGIADGLLAREGACTGCTVQGTCSTCMPLTRLYRSAGSPLDRYCQHREGGEVIINAHPDDRGSGPRHADPAASAAG